MLVIRRKQGESLRIGETIDATDGGDAIEVEVLELTATRVVLGIRAPASVRVLRTELLEAAQQNRAAAEAAKNFAPAKISSYLTKFPR
jgi:carbon storage regulator CsrA